MLVCLSWAEMHWQNYEAQTRACAKSVLGHHIEFDYRLVKHGANIVSVAKIATCSCIPIVAIFDF